MFFVKKDSLQLKFEMHPNTSGQYFYLHLKPIYLSPNSNYNYAAKTIFAV
jgi:hypothetical protein